VAYSDNNRDAERRDLQFVPASTLTEEQRRSRVDYLYSDVNIGPAGLLLTEVTGGAGSGAAAYSAQIEVAAVYAQVDAEIIPLVRTTYGVRFEDGKQTVTTRDLFGGAAPFAPTEINEQYYLPSFTATWNFAEDQQLRLGASRTIGRPSSANWLRSPIRTRKPIASSPATRSWSIPVSRTWTPVTSGSSPASSI
jgi:outer membrane receptor protein involved in Fe transport